MKRKRFTEEQVLVVLADAEPTNLTESCRAHNVSKATFDLIHEARRSWPR
ncbi:MAG: hypothetical protein ACI81R_001338 [Bradymonadia bacterium]|jgi:hypothetical protein